MGIRDRPAAPASPWQNGVAERLIGSIQRECVDYIIVLGEVQLRRILKSYASYYNEIRAHRSLDKDAPISSRNSANRNHQIVRHSWRTLPPLRPSLSFRYTRRSVAC
jgi:transposase InsO family protein